MNQRFNVLGFTVTVPLGDLEARPELTVGVGVLLKGGSAGVGEQGIVWDIEMTSGEPTIKVVTKAHGTAYFYSLTAKSRETIDLLEDVDMGKLGDELDTVLRAYLASHRELIVTADKAKRLVNTVSAPF